MHEVDELFCDIDLKTRVWVSVRGQKILHDFAKADSTKAMRFLKKLKHYAKVGFQEFEGKKNPIRPEGPLNNPPLTNLIKCHPLRDGERDGG